MPTSHPVTSNNHIKKVVDIRRGVYQYKIQNTLIYASTYINHFINAVVASFYSISEGICIAFAQMIFSLDLYFGSVSSMFFSSESDGDDSCGQGSSKC